MRRCARCKQEMQSTDFYVCNARKDGLHSWCKPCVKAYAASKPSLKRDRERVRAYVRSRVEDGACPSHKNAPAGKCVKCREYRRVKAAERRAAGLCPQHGEPKKKCERCTVNRRRAHLSHFYGITPETYEAMLMAQGGTCALCKRVRTANQRRLSVDHDHSTGVVRGLLCGRCNNILGETETADRLMKLAAYVDPTPWIGAGC